ncbi:transportin-3 [Cryptococcus deuterogattii MMRL2647]|nr:transportin-3 [Cryptococcus deuterogattii MMRL2647]
MADNPVLQALQTLYHDPDTAAKRRANEWLQEFQHSTEAWQTAHVLLNAPDSPLEGRLFSAQTLRAKITYDLSQLPRESLPPLRDSLLNVLLPLSSPSAPTGSKAVLLQLCLAISDLALQMPEWENVVPSMIERFGTDPAMVTVLLLFLKTLPEEATNPRIPLGQDEARAILNRLVSGSAGRVLEVLTMYIQAEGVTTPIQISVFEALRSWLQAGEVTASQVAATPLFSAAFSALASDQLFDAAVDLLCDLIHETQELNDNMTVVQEIVPRVIALRGEMERYKDDPDRVRGYCRILCEAGECYQSLIVQHPGDLLPLVQAIAECAAYPDLDIVPITFYFWYALSESLERQENFSQNPAYTPILSIFSDLQSIIISHLHFPPDDEQQTAHERDEFRTFRHRMGDTLKDCCHVLGATVCLKKSYDLILSALSQPSPSWQAIEAPLFSMRSMGAEVDPNDDEVLPHIMTLLPTLPQHPKIRYASILVISRYSPWLNRHPEHLTFTLSYVSAGFEMADEQVSAAAAHAMKFICQDCTTHLVPFLPQLHMFMEGAGERLGQEDVVEVCEAIAYIIDGMLPAEAASALSQFCSPLITRIQTLLSLSPSVPSSSASVSEGDLEKISDMLEQVDAYLSIVRTLSPFPSSCHPTAGRVYAILDVLLENFGAEVLVGSRVGAEGEDGDRSGGTRGGGGLVSQLIKRMQTSFEETGYASYLWIMGKIVDRFSDMILSSTSGGETEAAGRMVGELLGRGFESVTTSLGRLLERKVAVEIPDASPLLPLALSHTLQALTCPATSIILTSVDVLALLSSHLSLSPSPSAASTSSSRASTPKNPSAVRPIFAQYARPTLSLLLKGLIADFPDEASEPIGQVLVHFAVAFGGGGEMEAWVGEALAGVGGHLVLPADKEAFLGHVHEYVSSFSPDEPPPLPHPSILPPFYSYFL